MLRRILLGLGYVSVAVFVVGLTIALVAYGNDYAYDFSTGRIVQRGHVIVTSVPSGIRVVADGKQLEKKTPYQGVWSVGSHTFALERDGYWPWSKSLEVVAGQVSFVNYAVLVPKDPKRVTLDTKAGIISQDVSRDHRHLAYVASGPAPAVYTLELGNPRPAKLYSAAAATADAPGEVLEQVAWSDDASHLLIRSKTGEAVTYRLAPVGGGEVSNLTEIYKFDFTGLAFSGHTWRQLYWVSPDGGLRRLDVEARSVSAVLADNVSQFWTTPDRVLYIQKINQVPSLWSLDRSGKRQQLIVALPSSSSYSVAYANYEGYDELAIVPASTGVGTLYSGIFGDSPSAKVVAHGVTMADFSPDGHLALFASPTKIVTYDLEKLRVTGRVSQHTIDDQPGILSKLTWFDNFHLLAVRDGRLYWSEFDGSNRIDLGEVVPGMAAQRTSDYKSIVLLTPQAGGNVAIQSLQIR